MKNQSNFTSDEIKKRILEFLGQKRKKARSLKSLQCTVTDIKRGLKELNISQSEVVTNLDFLVQNDWVKEIIDHRIFKSPKGFELPSETRRYRLSDSGIRYLEGESTFDRSSMFAGINITNIGGITVVGNNNAVRTEYLEIFRTLDQLEGEVKISNKLSDEQKLSVVSDVRTIKSQLSKVRPDLGIVKAAIAAISFLGSIDGLVDLLQKVHNLLQPFIH